MKKIKNNKAGFTTVELLVTILIIMIFATAFLISYKNNQDRVRISHAVMLLMADLRRAQNIALSGIATDGEYGAGIYAADGDAGYTVFVDNNGNKNYNAGIDTVINNVNLLGGLTIDSSSPGNSFLNIYFEPPMPKTYFNGSEATGNDLQVFTITNGNANYDKSVITDAGGRIYLFN